MPCPFRRACRAVRRQATRCRSESPQQLTQAIGARRRRRGRPGDVDRTGATTEFNADVFRRCYNRCGRDCHWHELGELTFVMPTPTPTPVRDLAPPTMHQVGVDAVRQGDAGDRGAGLGTGREDFRFECGRVASPRATRSVLHSVHLSLKWTLSSGGNSQFGRCVRWTVTVRTSGQFQGARSARGMAGREWNVARNGQFGRQAKSAGLRMNPR
jgi:hypothetical protein